MLSPTGPNLVPRYGYRFIYLPEHNNWLLLPWLLLPWLLLPLSLQVHWLKTDFDKWRDEDDSDVDESKDAAFEDVSSLGASFSSKILLTSYFELWGAVV